MSAESRLQARCWGRAGGHGHEQGNNVLVQQGEVGAYQVVAAAEVRLASVSCS